MKDEKSISKPFLAIIGALFFTISIQSYAQTEAETCTARNSVFLEIGGNSGQYAFNYGRFFYQKGNFKINGNIGFSLWADPIEGSTIWNPAMPLELSALLGKNRHHLELGIGITTYLQNNVNSSFESGSLVQNKGENYLTAILPFRIGYRFQKPEGGFFFRVGYTPFYKPPSRGKEDGVFTPVFAGLSIGKSF